MVHSLQFCLRRLYVVCFVIVLSAFTRTAAECNACAVPSDRACVSATEYQLCVDHAPSGTIYTCDAGLTCGLDGTCQPSASVPNSPCNGCGQCSVNGVFACTGTQTFALCLGAADPSEIVGTCAGNFLCNSNNDYICGDGPSTCSIRDDPTTTSTTTEATTTTPSPLTSPKAFCETIATPGRYPIGTNPTTTCRQYISCAQNRDTGVWSGSLYYCPGSTYFDSASRICTVDQPARCTGRVQSLSLRNIELI